MLAVGKYLDEKAMQTRTQIEYIQRLISNWAQTAVYGLCKLPLPIHDVVKIGIFDMSNNLPEPRAHCPHGAGSVRTMNNMPVPPHDALAQGMTARSIVEQSQREIR